MNKIDTKDKYRKAIRKAKGEWDETCAVIDRIPNSFTRGYLTAVMALRNGVMDDLQIMDDLSSHATHLPFKEP